MYVEYLSPATLNYKGKRYFQGDKLEITDVFYEHHKTRFNKIDDNFVMDAEFVEIQNVEPEVETTQIQNVIPKKKKQSKKKSK